MNPARAAHASTPRDACATLRAPEPLDPVLVMQRMRPIAVLLVAVAAACSAHGPGSAPPSTGAAPAAGPSGATAESRATASATALAKAPGGKVVALDGTSVDISSTWEGTAAVVVFYRGFW